VEEPGEPNDKDPFFIVIPIGPPATFKAAFAVLIKIHFYPFNSKKILDL
jgi:hypothetical protein